MPDLQIAATANGNGVAFNVLRSGAVAFQVSGTFSATVNFEATVDQTNWVAMSGTTATGAGISLLNCAGFVLVRARISGYVSGAVSVFAEAAVGDGIVALGAVKSGALATGAVQNLAITVNASIYTVTPAAGMWQYLKVLNNHATAVLYVAVNEDPVLGTDNATPAVAADWKAGYPIGPVGQELIPLSGTLTTIRLLSDTATTPVVLGLIA